MIKYLAIGKNQFPSDFKKCIHKAASFTRATRTATGN